MPAGPRPGPIKRALYAALAAVVSWAVLLATRAVLRFART
jgi:hypothetical protein